jgi:tetratricopeptide (TPR) repeat protein
VVLIQYLVFVGQKEKAVAELTNVERELPAKVAMLALAQCNEIVGNREQAQKRYQEAARAQPNDVLTLQRVADFYLRGGQVNEAKATLKQIIALKHKNADAAMSAERMLRLVSVLSGEAYEKSRAALGMADSSNMPQLEDESIEQLRAKALTLALLKHRPDRLAAIRILVQIRGRQPLTASDQFLLAQLYESVGNWDKANVELTGLISKDGKNFSYLTRLARGLLRHGQIGTVPPLVAKLEEHYASSGATAEIKARLLHAQGNASEAVKVLREYAEKNENNMAYMAAVLEEMNQQGAAEDLLRKSCARAKSPESPLILAQFLGRHEKIDEALELCQKAASSCRPESLAAACLTILYSGKPDKDQCERVEKLLTAAIEKKRNVVLLDYLGAYHNLRGDFGKAETAFRDALSIEPNDPTALNNLSWLLAFQPQKNGEALDLAQRAIKTAGPHAGILDTRGVIHLIGGRAELAVKDLEAVVADGPTASHYFHLAQAHQLAKNRTGALAAINEAKRLGVSDDALHPLERAAYHQLCTQLGIQKN